MHRLLATFLAPLALLANAPDLQAEDEMREIKAGQSVDLRADRAYLLFRTPRMSGVPSFEPILMRVPTMTEKARYEDAKKSAFERDLPKLRKEYERAMAKFAKRQDGGTAPSAPTLDTYNFTWDEVQNLQTVDFGDAFVKSKTQNTYLVEVPPGEYVLYGTTLSTGLPRLLVCFCLGTVGWDANAGQITDLGYFYADLAKSRSDVPELAAETGYGPSSDAGGTPLMAATIRPARTQSFIPPDLADLPIAAAGHRAVGRFFNPNAAGINRLVPVAGILEYDGAKVIDPTTGETVPDNF